MQEDILINNQKEMEINLTINNDRLNLELEKLEFNQLKEIAREYFEILNDAPYIVEREEISKLNIRLISITKLLNMSLRTAWRIKRNPELRKTGSKKEALEQHKDIIIKAFNENNALFGKVRLSEYLLEKYQVDIHYRTLGRYMNELGLKCIYIETVMEEKRRKLALMPPRRKYNVKPKDKRKKKTKAKTKKRSTKKITKSK